MICVGVCPHCGTGPLGVRLCPAGHAVVLCDECDALWFSPDVSWRPIFPDQPELPCPYCLDSLNAPKARWAGREEIGALGWSYALPPADQEPRGYDSDQEATDD